jgi:hypothetical protein
MQRWGICVLAVIALAAGVTPAADVAAARPDATTHATAIPLSIKNVARRLVHRKVEIGEIPREVAKEGISEWLRSGAKLCPSYLPAPFFCPHRKVVWSYWGVGYALSWHNRVPGAWSSPSSPRRLVYAMTVGVPYWLTCWTRGDRVTDGGIVTRLWYRLRSGNYVNDGWFETGTNGVIPGVAHC